MFSVDFAAQAGQVSAAPADKGWPHLEQVSFIFGCYIS
jgi:hypothetical protein